MAGGEGTGPDRATRRGIAVEGGAHACARLRVRLQRQSQAALEDRVYPAAPRRMRRTWLADDSECEHPCRSAACGRTLAARRGVRPGRPRGSTMNLASMDWQAVGAALDEQGWAILPGLLDPAACREAAALWDADSRFRSRVVMARHGFGQGEYRYFAYPLPEPVARLRVGALPAARPGREPMAGGAGPAGALPARRMRTISPAAAPPARRGQRPCSCATGRATIIASTRISTAPRPSRCRPPYCFRGRGRISKAASSSSPSSARAASRERRWCRWARGTRSCSRSASGRCAAAGAVYRTRMKHGVSTIRSGERFTLGLIFHDAA